MQKDFSRHLGEHIVTCLLQYWDKGAGIRGEKLSSWDVCLRKGTLALSLWRQLLSGRKESYPFKEGVVCHSDKRVTMEGGIQYLRGLAVLEVISNKL